MQPSIEPRRLAHGFPRGNLQFHSAEWSEQFMYRCAKIRVRCSVLIKGRPQDVPGLCSMERPFSAARMRSRRFSPSSRLRTVILAKVAPPCFNVQDYTTIAMQSSSRVDLTTKPDPAQWLARHYVGAYLGDNGSRAIVPEAICECDPAKE